MAASQSHPLLCSHSSWDLWCHPSQNPFAEIVLRITPEEALLLNIWEASWQMTLSLKTDLTYMMKIWSIVQPSKKHAWTSCFPKSNHCPLTASAASSLSINAHWSKATVEAKGRNFLKHVGLKMGRWRDLKMAKVNWRNMTSSPLFDCKFVTSGWIWNDKLEQRWSCLAKCSH